jgi:hypothetical protein
MFGGINGLGRFLGLLAQLVRKILRARKEKTAQDQYDAVERDPAGAFIDRYGVRAGERADSHAPETNARKRNKE